VRIYVTRSMTFFCVCPVGFAKARCKSVLGFIHDIVLQTARRVDVAANLKKSEPNVLITPFATATFNAEFKAAEG